MGVVVEVVIGALLRTGEGTAGDVESVGGVDGVEVEDESESSSLNS